MPKTKKETKQSREIGNIKTVLEKILGYSVVHVEEHDRPDAYAEIKSGGQKTRVAVELTSYNPSPIKNDDGKTNSRDAKVVGRSKATESAVRKIAYQEGLGNANIYVSFSLNDDYLLQGDVPLIANEVIDFVKSQISSLDLSSLEKKHFTNQDFKNCQHLQSNVSFFSISEGVSGCSSWECLNGHSAQIKLIFKYIKSQIDGKNTKAKKYDWQRHDKKWLIIIGGDKTSNRMGPLVQSRKDDCEKCKSIEKYLCNRADCPKLSLTTALDESPFDGVLLCDLIENDALWLKQNGEIASLSDLVTIKNSKLNSP